MKLRKEAKLGIFGLAMLLLLFWGINYLKGKDLFVSTRTYYATFDKIDGIKPTTEVLVKGVKIGSVIDAEYNPEVSDKIVVSFTARSKYKIPDDSRVVVFNKFLVGGTVLNLEYGTSTEHFQNRDTIPSDGGVDFVNLVTSEVELLKNRALDLIANMNRTFDGVNAILNDRNIQNISNTLESVNTLVSQDIRNVVKDLNELSGSLIANTSKIDNIISNVEVFTDTLRSVDISGVMANLDSTITELNVTIGKLNQGEGTAAQFINNPALYDSLVTASNNLALLLEDVKANPKRYVHFSIFGRKNK